MAPVNSTRRPTSSGAISLEWFDVNRKEKEARFVPGASGVLRFGEDLTDRIKAATALLLGLQEKLDPTKGQPVLEQKLKHSLRYD